ncbi:hypothetical protein [Cupriavidus sp. TMH.W2]|uniref:hypothetical protein n=1 Tax=Cupriavidus sp. TMH.W2 TaxID=3434465 RepID=UPI003D7855D3
MLNGEYQSMAANATVQAAPSADRDKVLDEVMKERDDYHEIADKLAGAIAEHLGVDIGEHSSANCPWRAAFEAIAAAPAPGASPATSTGAEAVACQERPWRCFHCDETFTDRAAAAEHFGTSLMQEPGCQIDLAKFREMEELVRRSSAEDTDLHREIARLRCEHATALRREEENGYARGLRDAKLYPADVTPSASPAALTATEADAKWAEEWARYKLPAQYCVPFRQFSRALLVASPAAQAADARPVLPLVVLDALRFYASGGHFVLADDTAWDTVSGEPQNFWCDEAGTATVEDGSIAKAVLQGKAFAFEEPEPAIEGEVFIAAPATVPASSHPVVAVLIEVARLAYLALDDAEERVSTNGRVHVLTAIAFDGLSNVLDKLDELPDDQPGQTMGPAQKAEWALRKPAATVQPDDPDGGVEAVIACLGDDAAALRDEYPEIAGNMDKAAELLAELIRLDGIYREQQDEPCSRPLWLATAHHDAEALLAASPAIQVEDARDAALWRKWLPWLRSKNRIPYDLSQDIAAMSASNGGT